jgi:hypothetical protein
VIDTGISQKRFFHFFSKTIESFKRFHILMSSLGHCDSKSVSHVIGGGGVWELLIIKKKIFFSGFSDYAAVIADMGV